MDAGVVLVRHGSKTDWHWRHSPGPSEISVCILDDAAGWEWSGGVVLDATGNFCVMQRNRLAEAVCILRCDVSREPLDESVAITFRPELDQVPPYRVENLSLHTVRWVGWPPLSLAWTNPALTGPGAGSGKRAGTCR
jgi:hypothetical protein